MQSLQVLCMHHGYLLWSTMIYVDLVLSHVPTCPLYKCPEKNSPENSFRCTCTRRFWSCSRPTAKLGGVFLGEWMRSLEWKSGESVPRMGCRCWEFWWQYLFIVFCWLNLKSHTRLYNNSSKIPVKVLDSCIQTTWGWHHTGSIKDWAM